MASAVCHGLARRLCRLCHLAAGHTSPTALSPLLQPGRAAQPWEVFGGFRDTKSEPTAGWLELA